MIIYIVKDINDILIAWTNSNRYLKTYLMDRKFYVPVYIEHDNMDSLEKTSFFNVYDQEELIKFKGEILKFEEYQEVMEIIHLSQSELIEKLNEIRDFINIFKLSEKHKRLINKAITLLENYVLASNFVDVIKVKPFIKEYIKYKRR